MTSSGVVTSSGGPKHPPTTPTTTPTSTAATAALDPNSPQSHQQQQPQQQPHHHKSVKRSASALPSAAQDHRGSDGASSTDRSKAKQNVAAGDRGGQNLPLTTTTTPSSTPRNVKTAPTFGVKELDSAPKSRHPGGGGATPSSSSRGSAAAAGSSPTYHGAGQTKRQISNVRSSPSSNHYTNNPANSQIPSQPQQPLSSLANNVSNANGALDKAKVSIRGIKLIYKEPVAQRHH